MNFTLHKIGRLTVTGAAMVCFAFTNTGCQKNMSENENDASLMSTLSDKNPKTLKDFTQVNLVANNDEYNAAHIDPHLLNAWGLTFSSGGTPWISANGSHVSTIYDRDGNMIPARPEVAIPSPTASTGGTPTGTVVNMDPNASDFKLSNGAAGRFFFVGEDGILSGWNPASGNFALVIKNNTATSEYKGLTMARNGAGNYYLYAANFRTGHIDVWDKNFASVNMPFMDPDLPAGYAPFNIQWVGGKLYVMYALVGDDGDEIAKPGNGYVDIYNADGMLEKRFVSRGQLNAPWGVAWAPAGFFSDDITNSQPAILIGNFGDGRINAYNMEGAFLGQLRMHGNPIAIDGLWAIAFPPSTSTIDPNRLYFTAGPDDEQDGLFGYITK